MLGATEPEGAVGKRRHGLLQAPLRVQLVEVKDMVGNLVVAGLSPGVAGPPVVLLFGGEGVNMFGIGGDVGLVGWPSGRTNIAGPA
jgi:hypothetical protein